MTLDSFPKPSSSAEGSQERPSTKPFTFKEMISSEPVHGIGEGNRLTPEQLQEVEILMDGFGYALNSPVMDYLTGEANKDILDWTKMDAEGPSEPKRDLRERIKKHVEAADAAYMAA